MRAPAVGRLPGALIPGLVLAGVAATIAAGLLITAAHPGVGFLGTPLPPFLMSWAPDVRGPALAGVAVAAALVGGAPWAVARLGSPLAFDGVVYTATAALGLAVNAARRGPAGWDHVFVLRGSGSFEAHREYLPALADLRGGVARYVRDFPQLLRGLPTHTKGNPPGPLVAMHLLGITTPARLAAACIAVGALSAPFTHRLARSLGGADGGALDPERRGRVAAILCAFSPSVVVFGVTSVDYAFAGLGTAVAALLLGSRASTRAVGCVLAGIAAFCCWVLLAIPVWAVLAEARRSALRGDGRRRAGLSRAAVLAAGVVIGIAGVTLVLALVWGYDPIAILRVARGVYARGAAAHRPWAFWVFGSPAAFLAMLGAPIAWLALRALSRGEPAALALAVVIAVSALAGFTKAETERIWLPYVPLACVAAAAVTAPLSLRRLQIVLGVLALQSILVEILFGTIW